MPVAGRTSSPAGSTLDAVPALREPRLHFVPMVSLELDPALLRGTAGRHRPLQLPGPLLQGAGAPEGYFPRPLLGRGEGGGPPNRPVPRVLRPKAAPPRGASRAEVPRRRRPHRRGDREGGKGPRPEPEDRGGPRVPVVPLAEGGAGPRPRGLIQDLRGPGGGGGGPGGPPRR